MSISYASGTANNIDRAALSKENNKIRRYAFRKFQQKNSATKLYFISTFFLFILIIFEPNTQQRAIGFLKD